MKKLVSFIGAMMLVVYLLPLFTVSRGNDAVSPVTTASSWEHPVNSSSSLIKDTTSGSATGKYDHTVNITVLTGGSVVSLPLDEYLVGVLAAEMPASFPVEALKAQAVAARTCCLYQLELYDKGTAIPESHKGAQFCDDYTHCQAYLNQDDRKKQLWGNGDAAAYEKIVAAAVHDTDGIIAIWEGHPIAAVFHSAAAEKTEAAVDVWGYSYPYLVSVSSPGGESSPRYYGTVTLTTAEFKQKVLAALPEADLSAPSNEWFKNSTRSEAGGVITVELGGVTVSGIWVRELLDLNSTNFKYKPTGDQVVFTTVGTGHGVGLSQYGARAMALNGSTFDQIIKWYYKGVTLMQKS